VICGCWSLMVLFLPSLPSTARWTSVIGNPDLTDIVMSHTDIDTSALVVSSTFRYLMQRKNREIQRLRQEEDSKSKGSVEAISTAIMSPIQRALTFIGGSVCPHGSEGGAEGVTPQMSVPAQGNTDREGEREGEGSEPASDTSSDTSDSEDESETESEMSSEFSLDTVGSNFERAMQLFKEHLQTSLTLYHTVMGVPSSASVDDTLGTHSALQVSSMLPHTLRHRAAQARVRRGVRAGRGMLQRQNRNEVLEMLQHPTLETLDQFIPYVDRLETHCLQGLHSALLTKEDAALALLALRPKRYWLRKRLNRLTDSIHKVTHPSKTEGEGDGEGESKMPTPAQQPEEERETGCCRRRRGMGLMFQVGCVCV
ncbi:hypothetical protein KIPB_011450, partial [Kipferlia bialata]